MTNFRWESSAEEEARKVQTNSERWAATGEHALFNCAYDAQRVAAEQSFTNKANFNQQFENHYRLPTVETAQFPAERQEDSPEGQWVAHALKQVMECPALKPFSSPDCKLSHTVLPDGTARVEQCAPDGNRRIQTRRPDGTVEDKVTDLYGRPVVLQEITASGEWKFSEMTYQDNAGKVSPFLASKRITSSDGTVTETKFTGGGAGKPTTVSAKLERTA